jgi:hypothetical protein
MCPAKHAELLMATEFDMHQVAVTATAHCLPAFRKQVHAVLEVDEDSVDRGRGRTAERMGRP